ncbi:hypothetical protein FKM82_004366 [Ascaphus truei]
MSIQAGVAPASPTVGVISADTLGTKSQLPAPAAAATVCGLPHLCSRALSGRGRNMPGSAGRTQPARKPAEYPKPSRASYSEGCVITHALTLCKQL